MTRTACLPFLVALLLPLDFVTAAGPVPGAGPELRATLEDDLVEIRVGDSVFTCYKFAPTQKYPYFFPVNGPATGKSVTTESSQPYPHHHSLFFGCDRVSGGNYWQEGNDRGQIVSRGPKVIESSGQRVVIEDRCRWQRPGAPDPFHDERRIVVAAPSRDLRTIEFTIKLTAKSDVRIQKTNHALFSARMAPSLSVERGGRLVNANGALKHEGTHGVPSPWCDYSGTNDGTVEGLAILDGPDNRWHPCNWFTRDYGFFSPTPMYWLDADGLRLEEGDSLTLSYLVVVHAGNEKDANIAGIFDRWSSSRKKAGPPK